jgi:DNA helicase-2/ATP-dependent DNA helicase PcrA
MDLTMLNEKQREAVETTEGPLLVLAGAGSGKTRVLTHRIAYLMEEKRVAPWNILALTFTNKAAGEMRERVETLVGAGAHDMWVMTFHSACARILRSEIQSLGYEKTFVIYDDADQQSLLKKIIKELNINDKIFSARDLSHRISDAKNHSLDALGYLRESYVPKDVINVYIAYQKALKQCNALDFDDLLLYVMQLFLRFPDVLEKYRSKFRYILVDEYQDTNLVQYNIVRMLAEQHRNLCVVGDDDQSIYGWRGADIRNILEFEKDFPGATVIRLEQNYRSTEVILNAANIVISNNRSRKKKELWTDRRGGAPIDLYEAMDERDEANRICSRILEGARYGSRRYDDYAILYRTHAQSRILEMYLKSYDIPYKVYGGTSFFQRAEVKDIVAYLRLLQNSADDIAFLRVINTPRRGIGNTSIQVLQDFAAERNLPLLHSIMQLTADDLPRVRDKFASFAEMLTDVYMQFGDRSFPEVVEYLLEVIGYDAYLRADRKENYEARADIVNEFVGYIHEFTEGLDETQVDVLSAFLENVALFSATDDVDAQNGRVSMMTLHSAKGLEFPSVFLCGLEDGLFPSMQSMSDPDKLEEERRLCYVGITRAKEKLYLSNAKQRMLYGKISPALPSRFLVELQEALPEDAKPAPKPTTPKKAPQQAFGISMHSLKPHSHKAEQPAVSRDMTKPQQSAAQQAASYSGGQRVRHKSFGEGTVLSVNGSGASSIVEIAFDSGTNKKFAAAYAPIELL